MAQTIKKHRSQRTLYNLCRKFRYISAAAKQLMNITFVEVIHKNEKNDKNR